MKITTKQRKIAGKLQINKKITLLHRQKGDRVT